MNRFVVTIHLREGEGRSIAVAGEGSIDAVRRLVELLESLTEPGGFGEEDASPESVVMSLAHRLVADEVRKPLWACREIASEAIDLLVPLMADTDGAKEQAVGLCNRLGAAYPALVAALDGPDHG